MGLILVVDDVPDNVKLVSGDLLDEGYEIISATSGAEALRLAAERKPDLVLLDVMMPEMDGLEVCRRLKANPELSSIPVIMLTARGFDEDLVEGFDAGAQDYVTKPYTLEVLLARVQSALRVKRAHDDILEMNRRLDEARRAAEHAAVVKSNFLATMSHELRTPLNSVLGMTDLARECELPEDAGQYVERAHRCGEALLCVINDILDFSKIEAGRMDLEVVDFDIAEVIANSLEIVGYRAEEKGLALTHELAPEVPARVLGDPARLRQVLLNLVNNAIKFTEAGGIQVKVDLENVADAEVTARFEVIDTGIGIPADRVEHVFDSFSQADSSTTRKYGGTGLGLAICKRLCQMMGGEIGASSSLGQGSNFWFTVRFGTTACEKAGDEPSQMHMQPCVAVVGATNSSDLKRQFDKLQMVNHHAEHAADVIKQIEACQCNASHILIALPSRINVANLSRLLRRSNKQEQTRIIVIAEHPRPGDGQRFAELGASAYLPAPIRAQWIQGAISLIASGWSRDHLITRYVIEQSQATQSASSELPSSKTEPRELKILLVDDSEDNRALALAYMKKMPWTVEIAQHGAEAVEKFESGSFDLILMDIQMPVMGGYEATQRIRNIEASDKARSRSAIIALTASAFKDDIERALENGCDQHLAKPVTKKALIDTIRLVAARCLDKSAAKEVVPEKSKAVDELTPAPDPQVESVVPASSVEIPKEMDELIPPFLENRQKDLELLTAAIAECDTETITRLGHNMKGSGAGYGFKKISQLGFSLENAGKNQDFEAAQQALDELGSYLKGLQVKFV